MKILLFNFTDGSSRLIGLVPSVKVLLFIFTVSFGFFARAIETPTKHGEGLQPSGRFCHHPNTVMTAAKESGFQMIVSKPAHLRQERGEWVKGQLFLFQKATDR